MITKGTGNIKTEINSRTATVVFEVQEQTYRLKILKKKLPVVDTIFKGKKHALPAEVLGFVLYFPAEESLNDVNKLKDMWDALVKYGFKRVK